MSECFWQVLHHADPRTCFGTGNPRNPPTIKSPISLIYACRSDDVLMREDIARWCDASKQGRLERCVLAVSGSGHNDALPFPDYSTPTASDGSSVSEDWSTLFASKCGNSGGASNGGHDTEGTHAASRTRILSCGGFRTRVL